MLKISHVSKQYKLGQIGGTTLREEIQRWNAKRRHEEDPTRKIGARDYVDGETFMALDDVSVEVKKGEQVKESVQAGNGLAFSKESNNLKEDDPKK